MCGHLGGSLERQVWAPQVKKGMGLPLEKTWEHSPICLLQGTPYAALQRTTGGAAEAKSMASSKEQKNGVTWKRKSDFLMGPPSTEIWVVGGGTGQ